MWGNGILRGLPLGKHGPLGKRLSNLTLSPGSLSFFQWTGEAKPLFLTEMRWLIPAESPEQPQPATALSGEQQSQGVCPPRAGRRRLGACTAPETALRSRSDGGHECACAWLIVDILRVSSGGAVFECSR